MGVESFLRESIKFAIEISKEKTKKSKTLAPSSKTVLSSTFMKATIIVYIAIITVKSTQAFEKIFLILVLISIIPILSVVFTDNVSYMRIFYKSFFVNFLLVMKDFNIDV